MNNEEQQTSGSELDAYVSTGTEIERPAEVDPLLSAPILAVLERTWTAIRHRHADLPHVVMVLASGSDGAPAGWLKLGHFAAMRWETRDDVMPEVFVGGEGLARGPIGVLGTLLHEAAHALAHARGIKDTSRQGRYHNARYAELAQSVGLEVAQIKPIGWSNTTVAEQTAVDYAGTIAELATALTIFRRSEAGHFISGGDPDDEPGGGDAARTRGPVRRPASRNGLACICACGRRIRVALSVFAAGEIICSLCQRPFGSAD